MSTIIHVWTDDLLTVEGFAQAIGRPRPTVYRWVQAGRLNAVRIGKVIYIPRTEVSKYQDNHDRKVTL